MFESAWTKEVELLQHVFYVGAGAIITDVYTLSRLFKKFDIQRKDRGMPKYINNAIIYAGYNHSIFYRTTLEKCGFDVIFHKILDFNQRSPDRCLDVRKLPYPLFR